jgi:hypothetical protein
MGGAAEGLSLLGAIKLLGHQFAVPGENRIRFDHRGQLFECLLAKLYTDLGEGFPLTVTELDAASDLDAEHAVFHHQVCVAQQDLLVYGSRDRGQQVLPVHVALCSSPVCFLPVGKYGLS